MISNLRLVTALLVTGNDRAARLLVEETDILHALAAEATAAHFERLRGGTLGAGTRLVRWRRARCTWTRCAT